MRTKTLLLAAALGAAGVATSMAQVYSVNAVGYVNISLAASADAVTFSLIANPLNGTNNLLSTVIPTVPDGTALYFLRNGAFEIATYAGGWSPNLTWETGEGAAIGVPPGAPNPTTVTFVGEVPQGTLSNPYPAGFSLRSSKVPQAGRLTADLGFTPTDGDNVYLLGAGGYDIYTFAGGWSPSDPQIAVAQAFFLAANTAAGTWTRTFNVNP